MKKILILVLICCVGLNLFSQTADSIENKQDKKLTKEQKLQKRQAEAEATALLVDMMINERQFVLEAEYISNQTGNRLIVNSQLNFIKIDSNRIVIQIARGVNLGANGLGGITADGIISKWTVKRFGKKQQMYSVDLSAKMARAGSHDVYISINPDGSAQATLSGMDANKIMFYGKIVSLKDTRIFKGSSI